MAARKRTGKRPLFDVMAALARRLSGVRGANFIVCAECGAAMTPILVKVGNRLEVCSLACLPCQTWSPVFLGVVMGEAIEQEIPL